MTTDPTIHVAVRFKGATFRAIIPSADVDEVLESMKKVNSDVDAKLERKAKRKRGGTVRGHAMSFILDEIQRNGHMREDTGVSIASTILWLVCDHPQAGELMAEYARGGGCIFAYDVTKNPKSKRRTHGQNNWRLHAGPIEHIELMCPWLPPPDFATAGSA